MPVSNSYNLVSEWLPASLLPLYPGCYEIVRIDGERQIRRYELAPGGEPGQGAAWGEDVRRWRGMQAPKLATRQRLSKNVYAERQANDKRRAQRDALWVARVHVARAADASRPWQRRKAAARTALLWYQIALALGVRMTNDAPITDAEGGYTQTDYYAFSRLWSKFNESTHVRLRHKAFGFVTGKTDYRIEA